VRDLSRAVRARLGRSARRRFAGVDWRHLAGRSARTGFWLMRGAIGVALVLYALSFVGPAPVEPAELRYAAPSDVAQDAVRNLHAATYRVTVEAERVGTGTTTPMVTETRTVDNPGHLYAARRQPGGEGTGGSQPSRRTYGTYTTGYRLADSASDTGNWERADGLRYSPVRNAFGRPEALNDTQATVVTETSERYVVRVADSDAVAELVSVPGHDPRRDGDWNATLRLTVDRTSDRLTQAVYRYSAPEPGVQLEATYRFSYGRGVDVDRPLATYPPGGEALTRLDLGLRTVDAFLRGDVA